MLNEEGQNLLRRNPKNMEGLLRFAIEATKSEDAPNASPMEAMDPERRRFLEEALGHINHDIVGDLIRVCRALVQPDATDSDREEMLEFVCEHTGSIDVANDFCKIGGLDILVPCLHADRPAAVRSMCATVLAELAQNNPACQERLREQRVMPHLLPLLDDEQTIAGGVRAISAAIRAHPAATEDFRAVGGFQSVLQALRTTADESARVKILFLLCALGAERPDMIVFYVDNGLIETIARFLKPVADYDALVEKALAALLLIVQQNSGTSATSSRVSAICRQESLREQLQAIIDAGLEIDSCSDLVDLSRQLLGLLGQ